VHRLAALTLDQTRPLVTRVDRVRVDPVVASREDRDTVRAWEAKEALCSRAEECRAEECRGVECRGVEWVHADHRATW